MLQSADVVNTAVKQYQTVKTHQERAGSSHLSFDNLETRNAWHFCCGSRSLFLDFLKIWIEKPTGNQIFAYLALSNAQLSKAEKPEDLDQLCVKRSINLL